jgi:hypothetical protein
MDGLPHAARSQHANATMNATSLLTGLGIRYGTDKVQHNYLVVYDDLFAAQRLQVRRMLEIGVFRGASVLMWRDYFPHAQLVGMDLFFHANIKRLHIVRTGSFYDDAVNGKLGKRVSAMRCNHSDIAEMDEFVGNERAAQHTYDIIVEDGSHMQRDQQLNLAQLLPLVRPGGFYVIEDLHSSLESGYDELPVSENTTVQVLLRLQRSGRFSSKHVRSAAAVYLERWIDSVQLIAPPDVSYRRNMLGIVRKRVEKRAPPSAGMSGPRVDCVGWDPSTLPKPHAARMKWNPYWDAATTRHVATSVPRTSASHTSGRLHGEAEARRDRDP